MGTGIYMCENIKECDPLYDFLGKLVFVKSFGKKYSARLTTINNDELWFENRHGETWMESRRTLDYIGLWVPKHVL